MTEVARPKELVCPACAAIELCGYSQMMARLQGVGVMRRSHVPEPKMVVELFTSAADRFRCAACQHVGLTVREAADRDWDDWEPTRICQGCRKPISRERLEVFPATKLCADCQRSDESGTNDEPEYCPRCGEVMTIRLKSGTSRYVMSCPRCGSR